MPDKLSTFLIPFSAFQTILLSSHPAGHPSRQPHALIAAYGNAMGLSMDWTKSRALCNPVLSPPRSHPSRSARFPRKRDEKSIFLPICQGCAFDGRSKDIGGRNSLFLLFFHFYSPPLRSSSFSFNVQFYFSFHVNEHQGDSSWPYTQVNRYYHRRTLIPSLSW